MHLEYTNSCIMVRQSPLKRSDSEISEETGSQKNGVHARLSSACSDWLIASVTWEFRHTRREE